MTQEDLWLSKYNEVKASIETNHRNPSRYRIEDLLLLNWLKQNCKLLTAGKLKEDRVAKFEKLLELAGVFDTIKKIIQICAPENSMVRIGIKFLERLLYQTYYLLQKPYVMHNFVGKILVVVVDDSGREVSVLHR